jgi:hypothetical protein
MSVIDDQSGSMVGRGWSPRSNSSTGGTPMFYSSHVSNVF